MIGKRNSLIWCCAICGRIATDMATAYSQMWLSEVHHDKNIRLWDHLEGAKDCRAVNRTKTANEDCMEDFTRLLSAPPEETVSWVNLKTAFISLCSNRFMLNGNETYGLLCTFALVEMHHYTKSLSWVNSAIHECSAFVDKEIMFPPWVDMVRPDVSCSSPYMQRLQGSPVC